MRYFCYSDQNHCDIFLHYDIEKNTCVPKNVWCIASGMRKSWVERNFSTQLTNSRFLGVWGLTHAWLTKTIFQILNSRLTHKFIKFSKILAIFSNLFTKSQKIFKSMKIQNCWSKFNILLKFSHLIQSFFFYFLVENSEKFRKNIL